MGSDDLFKKRKTRKDYRRRVAQRGNDRDLILIVCEGTQSEPLYFQGFRLTNVDVVGIGGDPLTVVERAKVERNKAKKEGKVYDQVWCVFDRDNFPKQRFNAALQKADSYGFKVAYSNEAFELWYVLHFEFLNSGITREDYKDKLSARLGFKYQKNDPKIYEYLLVKGNQETAIRNADRLLGLYPSFNPEANKPSTTVHHLVQVLKQWKKS
ncbi:RloB family protein [Effusibacillus lacus]|uniref:Abortive infection protein n=1 Tax=Effusibacillus lacus TaxID=1348429 RepID=A0A292YQ31_9BACL|nr:RloB family protein [Effusibacillus lacus]TCS73739.1 RloB-like protein [Effusibacillus lacus]GAX92048.1 abortive infection protein [Effusibacillus lacus]